MASFTVCFTDRGCGTMVLMCPCSLYSCLSGVQGNHGELKSQSFQSILLYLDHHKMTS